MIIYLLSFLVLLVIVVAMSIGVIAANKPIKGTCGGMSALGIDTECDICGGDKTKCDKASTQPGVDVPQDLFYDASNKD